MAVEIDFKKFLVYEDDDIIVLNKPSGILSIQDGYEPHLPCLRSELKKHYGNIWTVHRLDKLTSGLILFAKNALSHAKMNHQFSDHTIFKNYRAVVCGFPLWDETTVDLPLKKDGDRQHRTVPNPFAGKKAVTKLKAIHKQDRFCFMDVFPQTGITHQIRAHLAMIGFPILGDRLYWRLADFRKKDTNQYPFKYDFIFLHAYALRILHPAKDEEMTFTAPLPDYFREFCQKDP